MTEKIERPRTLEREFVYHAENEGSIPLPPFPRKLVGIFAHLTRECGGNVHQKGIVNVTVSNVERRRNYWPGFAPENAIELGSVFVPDQSDCAS